MQLIPHGASNFESIVSGIFIFPLSNKIIYLFSNKYYFMKILVVQESDWLERNPHQQHHLMERMALRGHQIRVIDYPIDWPNDDEGGLIYHKEIHEMFQKSRREPTLRL